MHHSTQDTLKSLQLSPKQSGSFSNKWLPSSSFHCRYSPVDGSLLGEIGYTESQQLEEIVTSSQDCFSCWRNFPAPQRGELIRQFALRVRANKENLAALISWEMGKILPEALGEVQEVIDIADFAVGLSRQLYGLSMHSERPQHRMYEQWHPLGPVGVITAFNFPMAVWAWNACIAAVCGNTIIWKPSELTPFSALALNKIASDVAAENGFPGLFSLVSGTGASIGNALVDNPALPLISATGSTSMGREVGARVAKRFGRTLLELGGNNAVIVLRDADLELAVRAIVFGAAGTAGQRCTSIRRLYVEKDVFAPLLEKLRKVYQQLKIGNPLVSGNLIGPLIHTSAVNAFEEAIAEAQRQGAKLVIGGKRVSDAPSPLYVQPSILSTDKSLAIMQQETFAPILYAQPIADLKEGILLNNSVPHGLSSAVFTNSLKSAERFLSAQGSDCGIANVNIGTSGAEIGGAFGGEKETGGGREAGSDSWKAYMRRQTTTINWGDELPLAQGVKFE